MTDLSPLHLHGLIGGSSTPYIWQRPAAWPELPSDTPNKVGIIARVGDHGSNFCALSATVVGGYTVNWGDGTSDNVASGVQANHRYDYADTDLGSADADGWKYAVITVTPQSANNITALDIGLKHTQAGLTNTSNPWLDIRINLPSCTSLTLRSTSAEARYVQRVLMSDIGAVTSIASLFQDMTALREFPSWPSGSLASCTTVAYCYFGCSSLASAPAWPSGSLASCTTVASCYQNCYSLTSAPAWPSGSLASCTNVVSCYFGCSSLASAPAWPSGSLASCTSVAYCYQGCYSLTSAPAWPSGSLASCTSVASCYSGCSSLASAPAWPSGSLASCTTVAYCYFGCSSLASAPAWPSGSLGSLTDTTNVVAYASALSRWEGCIIPVSFSIANCRFGPAELDEVYTALPTVTGKTITVTGNWGTASDDPSIATAKGWTVVS